MDPDPGGPKYADPDPQHCCREMQLSLKAFGKKREDTFPFPKMLLKVVHLLLEDEKFYATFLWHFPNVVNFILCTEK